MAQPFSSRDELKGDPLQEWVHLSLDWIQEHRQTFFSIVGTIAVIGLIAAFIITNLQKVKKEAWERYSAGQNWLFAGNPQNAVNMFNEVITNYPQTPAAVYALIGKADLLYRQRNFKEAAQAYEEALSKNPNKVILPFIYSGLGVAQEDAGNNDAAILNYKKFISEFPDHFMVPKIYEDLGRAYELALNQDAAKQTYEKIITMYPSTPWSEWARARYQALAPQPFQSAPNSENSH